MGRYEIIKKRSIRICLGKRKKQRQKSNVKKNAAKKAVVLKGQTKRRMPIITLVVGCVILAGAVIYYLGYGENSTAPTGTLSSEVNKMDVSTISYPVGQFDDGKAQHFKYKGNGIEIQYFVLKSSDGVLRAAFDAYDVCWPSGKGYYQDGDDMVCRNCGRRFTSVRINEVKGGCNPAPLHRSIEGDHLLIAVDDILEGKQYFDFSKRSPS